MEASVQPRGVRRYLPVLNWLLHYESDWLRPDLIAGISVWALLAPQSIAYASVAGVPAQYGLYTALGALIGYALFGTSRQVITGPSATVAAVSATVVALLAASGSTEWIAYTAALAIAAGLIYILLGLLRMGWISNFLSTPVLEGFIFGFGFGLIVDQSHKILGVPKVEGSYFQMLIGTLQELPETNPVTLVVGVSAIILLLVMRRYAPKWPRALIVVILGIAVSSLMSLAQYGVEVVGDVPTGLPAIGLPSVPTGAWGTLAAGALAVIFVGFSESLAAAKEVASKHQYEIDASQEMIGQGMANGVSGLLGGFVVDGSLSKTTVADLAGMKSQMASLITAVLVLLTVIFFASLFANLPKAVLGAVVIDAALGLIKFKVFRRVRDTSRRDFAAFMAAAIGLFFIGVLPGVIIGVVLSLLLLIAAVSKSPVRRMGLDVEDDVYVVADRHPGVEFVPGILVAEIDGPLFFADADSFRQSLLGMAAKESPHTVVVDLGPSTFMDLDGADILTKLSEELGRKGIKLLLARVDDDALDLLRKAGTLDAVGPESLFETVRGAVAAARTAR